MAKFLFVIELSYDAKLFMYGRPTRVVKCTTLDESLHEALCVGIHEHNIDAQNWLSSNITDIQQVTNENLNEVVKEVSKTPVLPPTITSS